MNKHFYLAFLFLCSFIAYGNPSFAQYDTLRLLKDFCPGNCNGNAIPIGEYKGDLLVYNDYTTPAFYIFGSNGKLKNTIISHRPLRKPFIISPYAVSVSVRENTFVIAGGTVFFCGDGVRTDSINLYSWDGINTKSIAINTNGDNIDAMYPVEHKGKIYYTANNRTNNTATTYVYDIAAKTNTLVFGNSIGAATIYKDKFYYSQYDFTRGTELFISDINTGQTSIADIVPGTKSSNPNSIQTAEGKLYFYADSYGDHPSIYRLDESGQLVPIVTFPAKSIISAIRYYAGKLYFSQMEPQQTSVYYSYNIATAELKKDEILTRYKASSIGIYNNYLVFSYRSPSGPASASIIALYDPANGVVKDLPVESNYSVRETSLYYTYNNVLYRYLYTDSTGAELFSYRENPGNPGTIIFPNPTNSSLTIRTSVNVNQRLAFAMYDITGREVMNRSLGNYTAGNHDIPLNIGHLAAGVYVCTLRGYKGTIFTGKLVKL